MPSRDGIEAARNRIKDYLGWEEVRSQLREQLKGQELDPIREATLSANISGARSKITEQIQQAYSIVVTVSDKNEVQAFKITVNGGPLFTKDQGRWPFSNSGHRSQRRRSSTRRSL